MCDYSTELDELIKRATERIPQKYFCLPVAGADSRYFERVYCYELYHQMRRLMCNNEGFSQFNLTGEAPKGNKKIPDFLIHEPGVENESSNLAIIEVKPVKYLQNKFIINDLEKLTSFVIESQYKIGIYLFYGDNDRYFEKIKAKIYSLASSNPDIKLEKIAIYHHKNFSEQAVKINPSRLRRVPPK